MIRPAAGPIVADGFGVGLALGFVVGFGVDFGVAAVGVGVVV
ncbi:MAG: hypothetical protein WCJ42_07860 [Actinomycetes bacterium]